MGLGKAGVSFAKTAESAILAARRLLPTAATTPTAEPNSSKAPRRKPMSSGIDATGCQDGECDGGKEQSRHHDEVADQPDQPGMDDRSGPTSGQKTDENDPLHGVRP